MRVRSFVCLGVVIGLLAFAGWFEIAQAQSATGVVPPLVRYSGVVKGRTPGVVGVTFSLYKDQTGGGPLWIETQNIQVGDAGRFTVMLGANHAGGVPTDLFSAGEARWLGIQPEGAPEQDRVLLVSVPYAMKASDADTLGGKPLSAFVLAGTTQSSTPTTRIASAASGAGTSVVAMADPVSVTTGTANYLPKFADTTNLTNSRIFDLNGSIGIGTTTPESVLDIGMNSSQTVRFGSLPWSLRFGALQSGTQFIGISVKKKASDNNYIASSQNIAGVSHTVMEFHYDGSLRVKQQPHQPDGTALNLSTAFSIIGNGNVGVGVDKASQKLEVAGNLKLTGTTSSLIFPDGTTMKTAALPGLAGVSAGTGLKGGGTTGSPTLELDTSFTDARYLRAGASVVTGVTAAAGISATGTAANPVLALDTSFTDARYLRVGVTNVFTGDQAINGGLAVSGAVTTGPHVVNGDLASSGVVSGASISGNAMSTKTLQARLGTDGAETSAVSINVDGDTATGVDITSTTTTGTATGIHSTVNSPYAFAGIFDNIAGGSILLGRIKVGEYWVKKFRVDGNGRVYANNGYSTGGADFAESFGVVGNKSEYQPGDVLIIDTNAVRRLARSQQPYSTLVAGVYSTRPGVMASPYDMDDPNLEKEVPLAVVGVVPCKVTAENGPIATGDLLVTASTPGHAMKGTDRSRMIGAVVGKALQPLASGTGVIEILVSLQ